MGIFDALAYAAGPVATGISGGLERQRERQQQAFRQSLYLADLMADRQREGREHQQQEFQNRMLLVDMFPEAIVPVSPDAGGAAPSGSLLDTFQASQGAQEAPGATGGHSTAHPSIGSTRAPDSARAPMIDLGAFPEFGGLHLQFDPGQIAARVQDRQQRAAASSLDLDYIEGVDYVAQVESELEEARQKEEIELRARLDAQADQRREARQQGEERAERLATNRAYELLSAGESVTETARDPTVRQHLTAEDVQGLASDLARAEPDGFTHEQAAFTAMEMAESAGGVERAIAALELQPPNRRVQMILDALYESSVERAEAAERQRRGEFQFESDAAKRAAGQSGAPAPPIGEPGGAPAAGLPTGLAEEIDDQMAAGRTDAEILALLADAGASGGELAAVRRHLAMRR